MLTTQEDVLPLVQEFVSGISRGTQFTFGDLASWVEDRAGSDIEPFYCYTSGEPVWRRALNNVLTSNQVAESLGLARRIGKDNGKAIYQVLTRKRSTRRS